jgi:hypothetical protein
VSMCVMWLGVCVYVCHDLNSIVRSTSESTSMTDTQRKRDRRRKEQEQKNEPRVLVEQIQIIQNVKIFCFRGPDEFVLGVFYPYARTNNMGENPVEPSL